MKKSQVLAALALAFALGVAVIPTASTYASIDTETAKEEQIQSVYDEINALNDEYQKLQTNMHFNSYVYLYNLIEGENNGHDEDWASKAIADKIAKWEKGSWLDLYNDTWAKNTGVVNARISAYNTYLADNADAIAGLKKDDKATIDSTTSRINPLTKATSVSAAYKDVERVLANIQSITSILDKNYDTTAGNAADTLQTYLNAIYSEITGSSETWYNGIQASANNIFVSTDGTKTYVDLIAAAKEIKNISKNAYDSLFNNSAWTTVVNNTPAIKANVTGMQKIEAFKALAKVARALDKWSFVGPVVEGKAKTDAVIGNSRVVSYDVALNDTAAFKAAIQAFISGKPADNGNQGEGSNKPDQNAPDTGILANAEGSASTTVAMVAGIATALTAAGAGVVAYRNARRSSRK